ncbi:hypothetical protein BDV25DRAFT_150588 [Aspergillus avenaceus]|uniref:Concanavalin A-like lectin/glucanase domain-containing protein n=1 Tax=Aspergillus avenaceus TaxID=36643 RepID=A0A5N6U225_ASPAV|nr:hypothetical protein BDV25DRAFT_150588 [Aspergillus avenaceus]
MSTRGYENCKAGTFYGFTGSENNEFHPGDTFHLQWGAIKDGDLPLNISLGRAGGTLIDEIVSHAQFTTGGSLYKLVVNKTANCSLEQYSWAIPPDFNTTNPQYQIGLFDGTVRLGTADVPLFGWINWSPYFYVRDKSSSLSTSTTAASTSTIPSTATSDTAPTSSASSSSSTDSDSTSPRNLGIGIGVGVGGFALLLLLAFYLLRRRKKARQAAAMREPAVQYKRPAVNLPPVELPADNKYSSTHQGREVSELPG